jgi:hypothetical protein
MGALALGLDWGYGLTQRRVMQNAADASVLGAARLLAANVLDTQSGPIFKVYEAELWCTANDYANRNRSFSPSASTAGLHVYWSATNASGSYTEIAKPGSCSPPYSGAIVNAATRYVQTRTSVDYQSFFARVVGQPQISAAANATARIVGSPLGIPGPTWPMVRHFDSNDFASSCSGPCTPDNAQPVTFWSPNEDDAVYGNFKSLVDLSRYSANSHRQAGEPVCTGVSAAPAGKANLAGGSACGTAGAVSPPAPSGKWYTNGNENSQTYDKDCSVTNWFAYLFRGTLSLESDWRSIVYNGTTEFREPPSALSASRASCTGAAAVKLPAPSCGAGKAYLGDWVDVGDTGNLGNNIALTLQTYISNNGQTDYYSDKHVAGASSPLYGKYVVILVYLWDCGETYRGSDPGGSQWSLTRPKSGSDCSDIHKGNDIDPADKEPNRVHLFSAAPFRFYEGLVGAGGNSSIQGFWGGLVSDPGACKVNPSAPGCALNAFSNGVFLTAGPDD